MPRASRPCPEPGCPELTQGGRCEVHAFEPWANSTRRQRLPSNWPTLRATVLERDRHRCYLCDAPANEVDHKQAGDDHSLANLGAICEPCHKHKSALEGNAARIR